MYLVDFSLGEGEYHQACFSMPQMHLLNSSLWESQCLTFVQSRNLESTLISSYELQVSKSSKVRISPQVLLSTESAPTIQRVGGQAEMKEGQDPWLSVCEEFGFGECNCSLY